MLVNEILPVGKMPPGLLAEILANAPREDPAVFLGPGPDLDCAVIDIGDDLLILKADHKPLRAIIMAPI